MTPEEKFTSYKEDTIKDSFWSDDALTTKYFHYMKERGIGNGLQASAAFRREWRAAKDSHSKEYQERRAQHRDKK
jgi:hypothetical protein